VQSNPHRASAHFARWTRSFSMADVHTGVGPFLAIYLAARFMESERHRRRHLGSGNCRTRWRKRRSARLSIGSIQRERRRRHRPFGDWRVGGRFFSQLRGVVGAQCHGVVGTFFPPAMAGMTLGIVPARTRSADRPQRDVHHAGNVFGRGHCWLARLLGSRDVPSFIPRGFLPVTIVAIFFIRSKDIDFDRSRASRSATIKKKDSRQGSGFWKCSESIPP